MFRSYRLHSSERVLSKPSLFASVVANGDPPSDQNEQLRAPRADSPAAASTPQLCLAGE